MNMTLPTAPTVAPVVPKKRSKKSTEGSGETKKKTLEEPKVETKEETKTETKKETKEEPKVETKQVKEEPKEETKEVVESEVETTVRERLATLIVKQDKLLAEARQDAKDLRKLLKDFDLEVKNLSKKKKRVQDPNKKPSGLQKPVRISNELLAFLKKYSGVNSNDPIPRCDVVKYISSYIREHNLKNPELKREIQLNRDPNNELPKLFKPATYVDKNLEEKGAFYCDISIQRDIAHHFLKDDE